ncbi:MAG TPA: cytochrome P450, partial [Polyangiales bacterium]|nr:cytochrome P450 [Polyangiales bacterium]
MDALPPGPSAGLFSTLRVLRDPYGEALRCAREYGDPFTLKMPLSGPIVISGRPAAIRAMFSADPLSFASAAAETMAPLIGQRSLVALDGPEHLRARKLLAPAFHGARMRAYGNMIAAITRRHIKAIAPGEKFAVQTVAQAISLEVILRCIFGASDPQPLAALERAVRDWMNAIGPSVATFGFLRHDMFGIGP